MVHLLSVLHEQVRLNGLNGVTITAVVVVVAVVVIAILRFIPASIGRIRDDHLSGPH